MKPKKRYTSERQIIAEIEELQLQIVRETKEWEENDKLATESIRTGHVESVRLGEALRRHANDMKKHLENGRAKELIRLKEALSVFRTDLLPGITLDKTIPAG